jgi:putative endonuclease
VGHSSNPWKRLEQHQNKSGHKDTGSYHDGKLVSVFSVSEINGEADRAQRFIKKQKSRRFIEKMLEPNVVPIGALAQLVRVPYERD